MAYRNGVYVAFNGCGTTDPTESDIKYFNLMKAWAENEDIDFSFSNSHDKTYAVMDDSLKATLKARLLERMHNSKSMLLIVTENSAANRGMLNWEIEQAVETYGLPIIVAYTGWNKIPNPYNLQTWWPRKLQEYIQKNIVKTIHIEFKLDLIKQAIDDFSIANQPQYTVTTYTSIVYQKYGL